MANRRELTIRLPQLDQYGDDRRPTEAFLHISANGESGIVYGTATVYYHGDGFMSTRMFHDFSAPREHIRCRATQKRIDEMFNFMRTKQDYLIAQAEAHYAKREEKAARSSTAKDGQSYPQVIHRLSTDLSTVNPLTDWPDNNLTQDQTMKTIEQLKAEQAFIDSADSRQTDKAVMSAIIFHTGSVEAAERVWEYGLVDFSEDEVGALLETATNNYLMQSPQDLHWGQSTLAQVVLQAYPDWQFGTAE